MLFSLAAAAAPVALARIFVVGNYTIPSDSMLPTLRKGDRVLGEKLPSRVSAVVPGDIVTFRDPADSQSTLIKRVIALPGSVVDLREGAVFVDGQRLEEPYLASFGTYAHLAGCTITYPFELPEGYLWVMGDNRSHSCDSRSFGPVEFDALTSHVMCRYWPVDRACSL